MSELSNKVIMPTAEEVSEMEAEGRRGQKRRGKIEMVVGLVAFVAGVFATTSSLEASRSNDSYTIFYGAILYGVVQFGVGLARQFSK